MKFSIVTPTNNTKYLKELEKSILDQTYSDWEWVVLLNGGVKFESTDSRIRVVKCPFTTKSIGALKKYANELAVGDILVEVDHDDMLTPDCLEELLKAYEDEEVGFVYSDDAKLTDNFELYNPYYGWTYKKFIWNDKELVSPDTMPITPARFGQIYFAPDHVRSWRRSVYEKVGGHDDSLSVCDDLDLMHRMYMVTKFYHIPKVLYIYRITGDNNWLKNCKKIEQLSIDLYNRDILDLSVRFCQLNKLLAVDLCGGFNKPSGFISIDKQNGDIIADLEKGIPLPDNSVGVVRASDALEHIKDKELMMREIHRVLVPGGVLLSQTPSTDGRGAWQDPTHVSFWNQNSFWYWTRPEVMKYINNTDILFKEIMLYTTFPTDWHRENNISYVIAHLEKV